MAYRYIVFIFNLLLLVGLLCVYYKPYIVMMIKHRLKNDLYQQRVLDVSDVSNFRQVLDILISLAKVQIYKNSILITKINYNDQSNQMEVVINSQDLDNLLNYISALKVSVSKQNGYISDLSTFDNNQPEIFQDYLKHYPKYRQIDNTIQKHIDKQSDGDVDSFAADFSYTANLKINL